MLKEGVFPEDFFELRKKVRFDLKNATEEGAIFFSILVIGLGLLVVLSLRVRVKVR
ncbi:MAG: hypothetical protein ACXQTW_05940 [Candidatus Methanospirareceae archaeon]